MLAGSFPLEQLPEEWNRADVGLPRDRGAGRHAAASSRTRTGRAAPIGYFPTYALGNLISAQIWERVLADLPDLDDEFEQGEFGPLREWLRDHLHRHGRKFTPAETLERVAGTPTIDPEPYVRYLRAQARRDLRAPGRGLSASPPGASGDAGSVSVLAMAKTRVAINGFGRIGRNFFRAALERDADFDIVAANDLGDAATMAHLLKYDSNLGPFEGDVSVEGGTLKAGGEEIRLLSEQDPGAMPWRDLEVDVVIESTGFFTKRDGAQKHLDAGAKKVVISAPATDPDLTVVLGVNDDQYDPEQHHIVSNASCTTNCVAPMAKVLHDSFTIERGFMTTIHAYTNDQRILDLPHERPPARARRGDQPDPDLDRRRPRDRRRHARPEGEGRRRLGPRARPDGLDHRLRRPPLARDDAGGGQRGVPRRGRERAAPRATSSTPTDPLVSTDIQQSPVLVHLRQQADDGERPHGQGLRLVRQRVGLLVPARRPRREDRVRRTRCR